MDDASLDDIFSGLEEEEPTKESENLDDDDMLFEGIFEDDDLIESDDGTL